MGTRWAAASEADGDGSELRVSGVHGVSGLDRGVGGF
jgi:hypothetical protein